jgi:hypothetical protein
MANSNYNQVEDLVAAGKLNWSADVIMAFLYSGATFHPDSEQVSQEGGQFYAKVPVSGRYVVADQWLGLPIVFDFAAAGIDYQVILAKDLGGGRTKALAFFDTIDDSGGEPLPISASNYGTLVIRPEVVDIEDMTYGTGLWMTVEELVEA